MKITKYLVLLFCFQLSLAGSSVAREAFHGKALAEALRKGGFNIYFRHAATDWTRVDKVVKRNDWKSCDPDKMRQLVPQGRAAARRIGDAIRRMEIPVGRVWSSEYCRTRETARYLNLGPVSTTQDIMNLRVAEYVGGREALVRRARLALSTPPPKGTNTVFVAHGNIVRAATGAYPGEAGAAIFDPQGNGELKLVALVDPEEWGLMSTVFMQGEKQ